MCILPRNQLPLCDVGRNHRAKDLQFSKWKFGKLAGEISAVFPLQFRTFKLNHLITNCTMNEVIEKTRSYPNEIIVVGVVRAGMEKAPAPQVPENGDIKAWNDFKEALKEKYQFTRDTNVTPQAAAFGQESGKFVHTLLSQFGEETVTVGGVTVPLVKRTTKYGWRSFFRNSNPIIVDRICEELDRGAWQFVSITPIRGGLKDGRCNVRLTNLAVMGFWDELELDFLYFVRQRDPVTGKMEPRESWTRDDDGNYSNGPMKSKMIRHFVLVEEEQILATLRRREITNAAKTKIPEITETGDLGAEMHLGTEGADLGKPAGAEEETGLIGTPGQDAGNSQGAPQQTKRAI